MYHLVEHKQIEVPIFPPPTMGLAVQNFDIPIFFAHYMTHGLKYRSLKPKKYAFSEVKWKKYTISYSTKNLRSPYWFSHYWMNSSGFMGHIVHKFEFMAFRAILALFMHFFGSFVQIKFWPSIWPWLFWYPNVFSPLYDSWFRIRGLRT